MLKTSLLIPNFCIHLPSKSKSNRNTAGMNTKPNATTSSGDFSASQLCPNQKNRCAPFLKCMWSRLRKTKNIKQLKCLQRSYQREKRNRRHSICLRLLNNQNANNIQVLCTITKKSNGLNMALIIQPQLFLLTGFKRKQLQCSFFTSSERFKESPELRYRRSFELFILN